jgi:hypothetical protein
MYFALGWALVFVPLALWSLAGGVPSAEGLGIPPALAPVLAGGVTVAAWTALALGTVLIVGGGAVAHGLGAMLQRRTARPPSVAPLPAG